MSDYLFPNPDLNVCFNCKYYRHVIALGQGLRCTHSANITGDKWMLIPSRYHACEHFERRKEAICNENFAFTEESLKKIIRAVSALEFQIRKNDEEPPPVVVSFTFDPTGRRVNVSLDGQSKQISVEDPQI